MKTMFWETIAADAWEALATDGPGFIRALGAKVTELEQRLAAVEADVSPGISPADIPPGGGYGGDLPASAGIAQWSATPPASAKWADNRPGADDGANG